MEVDSKSTVLRALGDNAKQIPDELVKQIDEFVEKEFGEYLTGKAVYESTRVKNEKLIAEYESKIQALQEQAALEHSNVEAASKNITQLETQLEQYRADVAKANESRANAEREAVEFRRQRDAAIDERDSLQAMLERRSTEVERLQSDVTLLSEQLQAAIAAKCEVLAKSEEIDSMKTNLEFRERRMEQERTLLNNQIQSLTEDLNKRVSELMQIRRENTTRLISLQTGLDTKTEELKNANEVIKSLTESNNELSAKAETLVERLKDQREAETRYHDSFSQELQAQTKLAELYKDMSDDSKAQIVQLTDAVADLQKMLSENNEQYEELETKYKELQLSDEEIIGKKNECIDILKKELEDANELLKQVREQKLENVIESLAPSAAATSRLIKSGTSLTQLYTQYVNVNEEVIAKDAEIRRLNNYIEAIVQELNEKAPLLRKQHEDYEVSLENVQALSKQNDQLTAECMKIQEEFSEITRENNHFRRENERLKSQLNDLGRQVCFLLKEVEELRSPSVSDREDHKTDYHNSSDIISKRLVTFSGIEELQNNNQKLLALVRELSSKHEEAEGVSPKEVSDLRTKLTDMEKQQEELLQNQERQTNMMNTLIRQRDSYKKMYQNAMKAPLEEMDIEDKPDQSGPLKKEIQALKAKLDDTEKMAKTVQEQYQNYQKEKATNDAMINEQLDTLRTENRNLIQSNCKFTSVLEYKDEQLKIAKTNLETLKKQIDALEKRNNTYNNIIAKHEFSAKHLTDEALAAQSKLARAEVMLDNLRQEFNLVKDSETRLRREREAQLREGHSQSLLLNNLESIKASFERIETEGKIRLEQRLDETSRECSAIRRRLQEEQDRFRELSAHLKKQTEQAQTRMEEEKAQADKLRLEVAKIREELQEKITTIDELHHKLKHNIIRDGNPLTEQIRSLETQIEDYKSEIQKLQQQLKNQTDQSIKYCDVAESAEKQLREVNQLYEEIKNTADSKLQAEINQKEELRRKVTFLERELGNRNSGGRDVATDLRNQLIKVKDEAFRTSEELQNLKVDFEASKIELGKLHEVVRETDEKYAREMVLHSADIQNLAALKEEIKKIMEERSKVLAAKEEAVNALEISKANWVKREESLIKEKADVLVRLEELEKQNGILHTQLETLSTQLSISHSQAGNGTGDTSMDTSVNQSLNEEDVKSSDQLLQIIKFLRREKDILIAKFDILYSENVRVKSQLDLTTKQLEEAKLSETSARTKSDGDVITIAKYNEVLRKVETLNAITDSNRILREERDSLVTKITELTERCAKLEEELAPLQEQNRELSKKAEVVSAENVELKADVTRWRNRANQLIERANKTTPEDWRRLQQEREKLAKLLMVEKDNVKKATEAKAKCDSQIATLQAQTQQQTDQIKKVTEELATLKTLHDKLTKDLEDARKSNSTVTEELAKINTELTNSRNEQKTLVSKYVSVRALARKYKEQVAEESKQAAAASLEPPVIPPETQEQFREEGRRETQERLDKEHTTKITELSTQITSSQEELNKLRKENEQLKFEANSKYERSQTVLRCAKAKIQNLNEVIEKMTKEMNELRADNNSEERERLSREIEVLKRQLGQSGSKPSTSSGPVEKPASAPPTANIKPMAGQNPQSFNIAPRRAHLPVFGETPFASIRPISMPQRSIPIINAVAVSPQQQIVHTTGNAVEASSSPTSSHTDYMPATSSASSQLPVRQAAVPPTQQSTVTIGMSSSCEDPASTAESTQDMEAETASASEPQQGTSQQTQQAVALVLPRVEQMSNDYNESQSSNVEQSSSTVVASSQPASSSNTVTTSQAGGTKRTRETEGDSSSGQEDQQSTSTTEPQPKRTRAQVTISDSGTTEIEYQVPTSSQRDQEDDVICVDSEDEEEEEEEEEEEDEEDGPDDGVEILGNPDEEQYDEAENEAMEQEEQVDNNEVEVIEHLEVVPDASNEETVQSGAQSEAISSASSDTAPQVSYAVRGRNVAPLSQNRSIHGFTEESADDSIVPSTPTLYVPRRTDGFGEAVSSPHVPSGGRFTFNEPRTNQSTEQVEERDPLEDGTGRSVPTTPLQVSPQGDAPATETTPQVEESTVEEPSIPEITIEEQEETDFEDDEMAPPGDVAGPSSEAVVIADEGDVEEGSDGVSSEGEKPIPVEETEVEEGREAEASQSPSSAARGSHIQVRSSFHRATRSTRPNPIVWNEQSPGASGSRHPQGNFARSSRGRRNMRRQQNNYMRY